MGWSGQERRRKQISVGYYKYSLRYGRRLLRPARFRLAPLVKQCKRGRMASGDVEKITISIATHHSARAPISSAADRREIFSTPVDESIHGSRRFRLFAAVVSQGAAGSSRQSAASAPCTSSLDDSDVNPARFPAPLRSSMSRPKSDRAFWPGSAGRDVSGSGGVLGAECATITPGPVR